MTTDIMSQEELSLLQQQLSELDYGIRETLLMLISGEHMNQEELEIIDVN